MNTSTTRTARRSRLTVADAMTEQPLTIGREQSLAVAHAFMRKEGVRHLPVLECGEIIGIVSQRDLYFLETIAGVEMEVDTVEDAMSPDVYKVTPDTPLAKVAANMARRRLGCAVVVERDRVAGIFTATDALRVLAAET